MFYNINIFWLYQLNSSLFFFFFVWQWKPSIAGRHWLIIFNQRGENLSASVREKGLKWQAEPKLFEMYTWLNELFEKVEYGTTFSVHAYMCSILFDLGKTPRG